MYGKNSNFYPGDAIAKHSKERPIDFVDIREAGPAWGAYSRITAHDFRTVLAVVVLVAFWPPMLASADDSADVRSAISLDFQAIHWHPKAEEHVVDYELAYLNSSDKAIACDITVVTGDGPRDAEKDDYSEWRERFRKTVKVVIGPGRSATINGTLDWARDDSTMPSIRYYDEQRSESQYIVCQVDTNALVAAESDEDGQLTASLKELTSAAKNGFEAVKGDLTRTTEDGDKVFACKLPIPGGHGVELWQYKDPDLKPRMEISFLSRAKRKDRARQEYNRLGKLLQASYPPDSKSDEKISEDKHSEITRETFEAPELSTATLSLRHAKTSDSYEVKLVLDAE